MQSIEQTTSENLAQTLAKEMKQPVEIACGPIPGLYYPQGSVVKRIALPPGWTMVEKDDEKLLDSPVRKKASVRIKDTDSFIAYTKRHGSLADCTIWCEADYTQGSVDFLAILNDHGDERHAAQWRDHRAQYRPVKSEEWSRWVHQNKKPLTQTEFALFVEDNIKDIASVDGQPNGAQMLEMALTFEANQDMRFKSAVRLQNGGVQMSFVQDDDAQTLQKMQVFDRFSIGIPVFWNGEAYRIDARLRYRVRDGKLSFWYELIRPDKVLESATQTLIDKIRQETGNPFFFGDPFSN